MPIDQRVTSQKIASSAVFLFAVLLASKPMIDIFWNFHFDALGKSLNIQSLVALLSLSLSFIVAGISLMKRSSANSSFIKKSSFLFVPLSLFMSFKLFFGAIPTDWLMKYWSSLAGVLLGYHAIQWISKSSQRKLRFTQTVMASLSVILLGAILQGLGYLPWHYYDTLYRIGGVGRLSSFYGHPLDLWRVLIWLSLGLSILTIEQRKSHPSCWFLIVFLHMLLLLTTHRTSLILTFIFPLIVGHFTKRMKRGLAVSGMIIVGWTAWYAIPNAPMYIQDVFQSVHFVDTGNQNKNLSDEFKNKHLSEIEMQSVARGRFRIISSHLKWLADSTLSEILVGKSEPFPEPALSESHNQIIDLLEHFGLLGLILIVGFALYCLFYLPVGTIWKASAVFTACWYGLVSEPLAMPTMIWWAFLFATTPIWINFKKGLR